MRHQVRQLEVERRRVEQERRRYVVARDDFEQRRAELSRLMAVASRSADTGMFSRSPDGVRG